jgi:hypothetical protein
LLSRPVRKKYEILSEKQIRAKGLAQVVEYLLTKHKLLSPTSSTTKKRKKLLEMVEWL